MEANRDFHPLVTVSFASKRELKMFSWLDDSALVRNSHRCALFRSLM